MTTKHQTQTRTTTPVPAPLATVTDLSKEQTQAITQALNPLIANAFTLYVKLKNFHWHLSGSHFRDFHLLFDEQADRVVDSIDLMAERVRRIGGTTIRSIGHISQLQTIPDDNEEFVPPERWCGSMPGQDLCCSGVLYRPTTPTLGVISDASLQGLLLLIRPEPRQIRWFSQLFASAGMPALCASRLSWACFPAISAVRSSRRSWAWLPDERPWRCDLCALVAYPYCLLIEPIAIYAMRKAPSDSSNT